MLSKYCLEPTIKKDLKRFKIDLFLKISYPKPLNIKTRISIFYIQEVKVCKREYLHYYVP
jgi:hypothetical protein